MLTKLKSKPQEKKKILLHYIHDHVPKQFSYCNQCEIKTSKSISRH